MKKIILVLSIWLLAFSINAQTTITNLSAAKPNALIIRGDRTDLTITISGDYHAYKLLFGVKSDKLTTTSRLIQKKNVLAGGADAQLTATYTAPNTTVTIKLLPEDDWDFTNTKYYYDLNATSTTDSTNVHTLIIGEIAIRQDVITDFDGTDLPSAAERYYPITVTSITDGYTVKRSGTTFTGVDLRNVNNTSDLNKPISTATQAALNLKSDSATVNAHIRNISNPHSVTKSQVGLGNVDNTSDANKPISSATQTALNAKRNLSDHDSLSALDEKSYNSLTDKPTLGDLASLNSADTSKTQAKVISVNNKNGTVVLTTADIDTANNKKYVSLQEKNIWNAKQDALGFTPYTQTEVNNLVGAKLDTTLATVLLRSQWSSAFSLSHSHSNKTILDATQESFTTALKSNYDAAYSWTNTNGTSVIAGANIANALYSWAKASTKPSYSYSEISGTPNLIDSLNWNTAYTDRMKWDGGATGLVAATGRASLNLGTMAVADSGLFKANLATIYSQIAGSSSIVTVGILNSGSIAAGFGKINVGADSIITSGVNKAGTNKSNDLRVGVTAGLGLPYFNVTHSELAEIRDTIVDMSKKLVDGITLELFLNPSITPIAEAYGINLEVHTHDNNTQNFTRIEGSDFSAQHQSWGTMNDVVGSTHTAATQGHAGHVVNMDGARNKVSIYSQTNGVDNAFGTHSWVSLEQHNTLTNASVMRAGAESAIGGTITNLWMTYLETPSKLDSAAITNDYGLFIDDQTKGTTLNYSIYTKLGQIHFGDNIDADSVAVFNGGAVFGGTIPITITSPSSAQSMLIKGRAASSHTSELDFNSYDGLTNYMYFSASSVGNSIFSTANDLDIGASTNHAIRFSTYSTLAIEILGNQKVNFYNSVKLGTNGNYIDTAKATGNDLDFYSGGVAYKSFSSSSSPSFASLSLSGDFTGSATMRGSAAFTTTDLADTVVVSGASVNDYYQVTWTGATAEASAPTVEKTATGFIVRRSVATVSGLTYDWDRKK